MKEILPIGTEIIFLKDLTEAPSDESPAFLFAKKDDKGIVTGHGCKEGHWVKWDKFKHPFGAKYGVDFKELKSIR
jgi:hypothetical protein